jgi:RNA polymerase sigma-70 factor (ECF subfamily)
MSGFSPSTLSWAASVDAVEAARHEEQHNGSPLETLRFEEVYAEQFDFVWRAARGLGMGTGNVDDVVQEVFLIVHRKLHTLETPRAIRSWLFGITRRVCKDHRRSLARRGPHVELDQQREVDPGKDPQAHLVGRQELLIVERYVDGLDEENRALFFLTLLEGLPIADAAKALNLNANTTYSRVRILRQELQGLLTRAGDPTEGS